ncbi:tyrosine-type recombinase/integrase [Methanobrevibacter sp.]|uniref:tyrosine-type recombinase/integrase n=1 Tax=Methanobrevibacter sp. TaxID=66852 RepID=UPI00386DB45E
MPKNNDRIKFTETDPKLMLMVKRRSLTKNAKKNYDTIFNEIYNLLKVTPSEIVEIGKKEQKPFINDEGLVDILDLEDRKVTEYQIKYKDHLDKKGNAESTKKLKLDTYRALLGEYNIQKPKSPKIKIKKDRIRESDIISWRDVEKAMNISKGIREKSIIAFLATTGMRGTDMLNLNIKDLITGCKIYFDDGEEHTLENLLKKDPQSIIPCYEIMPTKTDDKSQLAMTFNTPECSEYLWQYLKERIDKKGELKPSDPLFANRSNRRIKIGSLEKMFQRLNKQLGDEKDKNGVYGKFRKHSMRKLFSTTCRKNMLNISLNSDKTTEMDVVSIFTGHVPPNESNSKAYEAIPDDSEDSYLREIYFKLVPYLSIKDTEVHHINSKEVTELTEKIDILEEQNQQKDIRHQREMEEKDKEIAELKQLIHQTQEQVDEKLEAFDRITSRKTKTDIEHIINNYCQENLNEEDQNKSFVIRKLALDMALENKKDFENTDEYLSSLIKKARIKISMSGKTTEELFNQIMEQNNKDYIKNKQMTNAVREVMKTMTSNTELMEIISDEDYYELQDAIETYLKKSDYDITNLTDSDKTEIVSAVLMEFV